MVGPPMAPRRAYAVGRVDHLLAKIAERHGIPYVRTASWSLSYLPDELHLTQAGHTAFGDRVQDAILAVGAVPALRS